MPNYYPKALVELVLRLDNPAAPVSPLRLPAGFEVTEAALVAAQAALDSTVAGAGTAVVSAANSMVARQPIRASVIPESLRIRRTIYETLGEGEITLPYKSFPVDFRNVKTCQVACFLGTTESVDSPLDATAENLVFRGSADEGEWKPRARNSVELIARDETTVLLDTKWSGRKIVWDRPLDELVREVLRENESTAAMAVELRDVRLSLRDDAAWKMRNLVPAAARGEAGQDMGGSKDETVWNVISRLARSVGFVAWVENRTVILGSEHGLPRERSGVRPLMVWGRNLKDFEARRFFNQPKAPAVRVVSWSVTLRKTLTAVYPQLAPAETTADGSPVESLVTNITANGIDDVQELARLARLHYERLSRMDVQVKLETADFSTAEGARLLAVVPGSLVHVFFSEAERECLHAKLPLEERVARLVAAGFRPLVAQYIAESYDWLGFLYRVHNVEINYHHVRGFSLRLEATREVAA